MSFSAQAWARLGAYTNPISGTGMAFHPLGVQPPEPSTVLHEVGFLRRRPFWRYPNTFSPFWRLYYNFAPGHRCIFADKDIALTPDRIVVIPEHVLFHSVSTGAPPHFWITFTHARQLAQEQAIPIQIAPQTCELQVIEEMARLLRKRNAEALRTRIHNLSHALLHLVLSRPEIAWEAQARPDRLSRVVRHIEQNLERPLYNAGLARVAGMSETRFAREFRSHFGVSPAAFVAQVRVRACGYWLTQTDASLDDIAAWAGFPNRHYFSRVFKRVTGESPALFRTNHRVEDQGRV